MIGKVFPVEQAREAYTLMQEGKNYSKIVLKISSLKELMNFVIPTEVRDLQFSDIT